MANTATRTRKRSTSQTRRRPAEKQMHCTCNWKSSSERIQKRGCPVHKVSRKKKEPQDVFDHIKKFFGMSF